MSMQLNDYRDDTSMKCIKAINKYNVHIDKTQNSLNRWFISKPLLQSYLIHFYSYYFSFRWFSTSTCGIKSSGYKLCESNTNVQNHWTILKIKIVSLNRCFFRYNGSVNKYLSNIFCTKVLGFSDSSTLRPNIVIHTKQVIQNQIIYRNFQLFWYSTYSLKWKI